jgi:hypothetical protein
VSRDRDQCRAEADQTATHIAGTSGRRPHLRNPTASAEPGRTWRCPQWCFLDRQAPPTSVNFSWCPNSTGPRSWPTACRRRTSVDTWRRSAPSCSATWTSTSGDCRAA